MADYRLTVENEIVRTSDGALVPNDPDHVGRREFVAWLAAGNAPDAPLLVDVKAQGKAAIDSAAEAERLKYITAGAGMALSYEAKRTEAARWHNAGEPASPDAVIYPWAAGRAATFDTTIAAVLAEWLAQANAWAAIGIAIEGVREAAKTAIAAAEDEAAARAVVAAIAWPTS